MREVLFGDGEHNGDSQIAMPGSVGLPRFTAAYVPGSDRGIELASENYTVPISSFEDEVGILHVLGNPIIGETIAPGEVWRAASEHGLSPEFLRRIDGEFLFIHLAKESGILRVSTDRFTSIPFFYFADESHFFGSVFYRDVWGHLRRSGKLQLNESAFFEFLWLQRLLGTKTYDRSSSFMLAATTVTYRSGSVSANRYWSPLFEKTRSSVSDSADRLAGFLHRSIKRKTSDDPGRVGMFLSGGTDSRTVLGSFDEPPVSFTIAVSDNNEVRTARTAADVVGSPHVFIPLGKSPYSGNLDEITLLGGGMHAFDHGIFYGLKNQVAGKADVVFHGHGVDYMFQGMYLLARNLVFLGRQTSFKKLEPISTDFTGDYLSRISHRLKGINLIDYVIESRQMEMLDALRASVEEVRKVGADFCRTPDDEWEYMLIHALARHYPYTNLTSMGTCAEQRTAAFDNDVFDLYLSLPKSHRLDGKMANETLKRVSPQLAAIPTANTNERPDHSPLRKDAGKLVKSIRRRAGLGQAGELSITPEERTWPDRGRMFVGQPKLREAALALCGSEALSSLGFLDMDRLADDVPRWLEHPDKNAGAFMTFLVTIDRFLKLQA